MEKHFPYFTARPQITFKLGMTILGCSILSFLYVFLKQGDTCFMEILCTKASVKKSLRMMSAC